MEEDDGERRNSTKMRSEGREGEHGGLSSPGPPSWPPVVAGEKRNEEEEEDGKEEGGAGEKEEGVRWSFI